MIELSPTHWVWPNDLRTKPFGREDPPEVIEECVSYFEARGRAEASRRAHQIKGRIVAGKVLIALRMAEPVQQQPPQKVMDRMLAYLPKRRREVPKERLVPFASAVAGEAQRLFGNGTPIPVVENETDPDSSAAHRVTVHTSSDMDPREWAGRVLALQKWAAANLDDADFQAIRLLVLPQE